MCIPVILLSLYVSRLLIQLHFQCVIIMRDYFCCWIEILRFLKHVEQHFGHGPKSEHMFLLWVISQILHRDCAICLCCTFDDDEVSCSFPFRKTISWLPYWLFAVLNVDIIDGDREIFCPGYFALCDLWWYWYSGWWNLATIKYWWWWHLAWLMACQCSLTHWD